MRYQLDFILRRAEGVLPRVLGATERRGFRPLAVAFRIQGRSNRRRVDFAHQLADVLLLAIEPAVGRNPARQHDGFSQRLRQGQRVELGLREIDQLFAERL